MVKINWRSTLKGAGKCLVDVLFLGTLGVIGISLDKHNTMRGSNWVTADYYGTVTAITNCDSLFASSKQEMIAALKRDGDSGYYKTVINIVNNPTMFSSAKIEAIKAISK